MTKTKLGMNRRQILAGASAIGIGGIVAPAITGSALAQSKSITVVSWGGSLVEAMKKHWIAPFTKETGINVAVADGPDLAKLKAQSIMGRSEWDVFDASGAVALAGTKQGFWAPLDRDVIKSDNLKLPASEHRVGMYFFAGGIAFDPKTHPEGKHPTNFKEFFDAKAFPGKRALRTRVSEMLEIALIADGVAPKDLYPLDVERAFRKLDTIKPIVTKWVEQTPQTISLIQNGEVDYSYTYSNRAKVAQESGASIDFALQQVLLGVSYLTVPKASPNKPEAMQFIAFILRPDRQAAFADELGLLPNNQKAVPLMSEASRKWVPNLEGPNSAILNDEWWGENFDKLQARFKQWLLI
ncbi:polyamine ABC transporter substrate-binding protein [Bradyrhizobium sp. CCGUVB1N3]|uniref:ABC transporter substrate-binding protein n=1 Tax=Bradyrhizobium sp. CCGUVB1N3 TaxID=2949629 RepID=UPI0020B18266|nr:polyamine ABC transporter substrate-binding protein [Bradyrhizobium sp. CCGUVB1N3]MCP3473490.1 polyamine ABC transporter substrate-binding protein [Bradyrhizobium sp. CCGUVB1N3]